LKLVTATSGNTSLRFISFNMPNKWNGGCKHTSSMNSGVSIKSYSTITSGDADDLCNMCSVASYNYYPTVSFNSSTTTAPLSTTTTKAAPVTTSTTAKPVTSTLAPVTTASTTTASTTTIN
jgi:hypothetical protein